MKLLQAREIVFVRSYDNLSHLPVADVMCTTKLVHEGIAFYTQLRLERIMGVVDAGMDDFAVSAAGLHAYRAVLLEHEDALMAPGYLGRYSQTDDAGADDGYFDFSGHFA